MTNVKKDEKAQLRMEYLRRRDLMGETRREEESRFIISRLMGLAVFQEAEVVLTYVECGSEAHTAAMIGQLLAEGKKRVFVPKVTSQDGDMDFFEITGMGQLMPGYMGIREPVIAGADGGVAFAAGMMESHRCLLIVPGVVFDRDCGRIGYGWGTFDRYMRRMPLPCVAIAFAGQIAPYVPMEEHDIRLAAIVTEKEVFHESG